MECSCGGTTVERQVQKCRRVVGEYAECTACGRIVWRKKPDGDPSAVHQALVGEVRRETKLAADMREQGEFNL